MGWTRYAETAKTADGHTIRRGSRVQAISIYDGTLMNIGTVVMIWRQGADGTIVKLDVPPDPEFPHHFTHRASKTHLVQS